METAEEKYKIIEEMISRDNDLLNISKLCEIAEVSRSGFYNWKNSYNRHQHRVSKAAQGQGTEAVNVKKGKLLG